MAKNNKETESSSREMANLPKNPKLRAIATAFALDVPQLIHDAESEILKAWAQAEEEAQLNETKPKFALSFGITLDLDKDSMETKLSFSVRHSRTIDRAILDPDQPTLPLDDTTVELSVDGVKTAKMGLDEFSKAAKRIVKGGHK